MDLNEMPKACKNNGVCNIIPSIQNGNSLKGKISSIRQLHSSVHSREMGAEVGAMRTLKCVKKIATKYRKLQGFCFNKIYPAISFTLHGCILE